MYKYAMCLDAIPSLANSWPISSSLCSRNKRKPFVLTDNTLRGGIVGDDGVDRLAIGPEVPEGRSPSSELLQGLKSIGVILAVDSKMTKPTRWRA